MNVPDLKPCPACGGPAPLLHLVQLRAALQEWRDDFADDRVSFTALAVRRAIDAVLAAAPRVETSPSGEEFARLSDEMTDLRAEVERLRGMERERDACCADYQKACAEVERLTKERDELRAEVARYIRDRVCDCDEMCQGMRLTKERDEARAEIARLVANPPDVSFCPEVDRLKGQVALLKQMLRDEIAREGGDGK